jgi:hypothetical protein
MPDSLMAQILARRLERDLLQIFTVTQTLWLQPTMTF